MIIHLDLGMMACSRIQLIGVTLVALVIYAPGFDKGCKVKTLLRVREAIEERDVTSE